MKKILIALGVIATIAVIAFLSAKNQREKKGTKVYVETTVRREIVSTVKSTGEVEPKEKVNISAHVIGKIEKLYVQEGDTIRAGQPFLELEKDAFRAQRDQWAAQLASAQTAVKKSEVALADSEIRYARSVKLAADGIVSPEQQESAALARDSARLSLDEAREAVRQARANLDNAKTNLAKTTIFAPLSGRVIKLSAEEGEVVVSGTMNNPASVIGVIADLSEIQAKVDVDETEIVNVELGQVAEINVDAIPDRVYHGKVIEIGSSGYNRPQQPDVTFFSVEILLTDADEKLKPGMSVRASVRAAAHADALVVPIQAVLERYPLGGDGKPDESKDEIKVVYVIEGGKARQKAVTTGLSDETHVEILTGIEAGTKIVSGPYRTLRDLEEGEAVYESLTTESEDRKLDEKKAEEK